VGSILGAVLQAASFILSQRIGYSFEYYSHKISDIISPASPLLRGHVKQCWHVGMRCIRQVYLGNAHWYTFVDATDQTLS
jgi:hypothetical protein